MGLINDDQVISSPVETLQVFAVGLTLAASQIGVVKQLIVKAIICQFVIFVGMVEGGPVITQFLWAQY